MRLYWIDAADLQATIAKPISRQRDKRGNTRLRGRIRDGSAYSCGRRRRRSRLRNNRLPSELTCERTTTAQRMRSRSQSPTERARIAATRCSARDRRSCGRAARRDRVIAGGMRASRRRQPSHRRGAGSSAMRRSRLAFGFPQASGPAGFPDRLCPEPTARRSSPGRRRKTALPRPAPVSSVETKPGSSVSPDARNSNELRSRLFSRECPDRVRRVGWLDAPQGLGG